MSIYGNISNAAKTNLTFDKVYPNRATMDAAAREDEVLIGRYVLVEYNDGTEPKRKEFFLKDEDMEIINISHKSTSGISNEERKEIQAAQERVKKGFNLYYWIDKPQPEVIDNNYEKDKVISWVNNEEEINKYDDGVQFKGYVINPDEIVRARLLLGNSYQPVYKDKSEEIIDYIEPKADQASLFYFFKAREAEEEEYENNEPIIFDYLGLSNEDKGVYDDYSRNYIIDNEAYKELEWPEDGYDSTIWQKCVVEGQVKYLQIASLNSEFPQINILPEAPSYGDVVRPYLDAKGTNKLYNLHFPTQWGFKIKEYAEKEGNPTDVARLEDNKTTHLGIYFNKAGFDKNVRHMDDLTRDNYIDFTPTKSKKKYLNNKGEFVEKDDIQELSISLPAVGDALCELYDTLYGVYDGEDLLEERNTEHTWGNKEGARAVEVGPEGIVFNKNNLSSLAGLINSTQDLMGQNIQVAEVSEKNGYQPLATADRNTIYYVNYGDHTPEEGYIGPNFYRKIEKIVIAPIDNSDYGNYIIENEQGRKYYQLDQFEADAYYTKYNLDIKDENGNDLGLYNFYLERDIVPDITATYYHNTAIAAQPIQLLQWAPYEPDVEGNIIPLYYKEEDNYIQVSHEEEPRDIEYFYINAQQKIYPDKNDAPDYTETVFYNPEAYISKEDPTTHIYGSETMYDNGVAVPDENGHIYYEGYFYMDENDNNKLVPVFNEAYREGEVYYHIRNYYKDKTQVEGEGEVDAYYARVIDFNSNTVDVPLTEENIRKYNEQFKINLVNFEPNKYFSKQENKDQKTVNYIILKSKEEIDTKQEYFTVEVTEQLTGEIKNPENPEEIINKRFYIPNTYFYLMELTEDGKGNYLLDRKEKMTEGVKYFSSVTVDESANTSGSRFYTPDKYYYADVDGDISIDRNDIRTVKYEYVDGKRVIDRNTTNENYIYTDKNNGNELAYFLPRTVHIISDENKKYEPGAIWNKQFEPSKELTIGIRKFPGDEDVEQSEFDAWEILEGYGKDSNTINGIILNSAKKFEYGNYITRDEETVQGGLNRVKDQLDNFADLDEKQLVMVDGYGRINSCDVESDRWLEVRTDSWTYYDAEGNIIDIDKVTEDNWAKRALVPRIRLDHAVPGEPTGSAGQTADQVLEFGKDFTSSTFAIDDKGHVVSTEDHTITLPTLSINDATSGKVMIDLDLDQKGAFTIKDEYIGNLPLTEYVVGETANNKVEATDKLNAAIGKLQGQLNLLNADASVEGSVANQIAEIVEVDGGAIDKLKEIAYWIVDEGAGAAKIIADVADNAEKIAKNAKDIADNKTEYDANKILTDAAIEANTNLINSNKEATDQVIADNKLEAENAIKANTNLINSNKEATDQAIADNKEAIENNATDILTLLGLVGEKSVEEQINDAITAENLSQYALNEDLSKVDERLVLVEDKVESWDEGLERTTALETLIDEEKVAVWDKAEENVQADWAEEAETADSFIKNKPDLSDIVRTADLDDVVKTTTTFDYIYNETTIEMTISQLLEKIADLEARIAVLENPVSPEPEPDPENPEEELTE